MGDVVVDVVIVFIINDDDLTLIWTVCCINFILYILS